MGRVSLQKKLEALIPTDSEPDPSENEAVAMAPVLNIAPEAVIEAVALPAEPGSNMDSVAEEGEVDAAASTGGREAGTAAKRSSKPKRSTPARPLRTSHIRATALADTGDERTSSWKHVGLVVSESIDRRMLAHQAATKKSLPTILMDAVESTYEQLPDLIAEATGRIEEPARPSLFGRSMASERRKVNAPEAPTVRHTLRLSAHAVTVLDGLVDEMESPSRTLLMVTALDTYLPADG